MIDSRAIATALDFEAISRFLRTDEPRVASTPRARQPVHTVYGGAHLFAAGSARKLGDVALRALDADLADVDAFSDVFGLDVALADRVRARVIEKLRREPVEDQRIDFEDGFGIRSDDQEDEACVRAARALGADVGTKAGSPIVTGIRIKALSPLSQRRALRTFDRFFQAYFDGSRAALPARFVVTLPKVERAIEVEALVRGIELVEERRAIPRGSIGVELMVETPAALFDRAGALALPSLVDAAAGRCVAVHLGAYDLTASLEITASAQRLGHPVCDLARVLMQLSLAGRDVAIVDGATTTLPMARHRATAGGSLDAALVAENRAVVRAAWRRHFDDVTHALDAGIYQGWDLHPAQLVSRYAAVFAFFLRSIDDAARRLSTFLDRAAQASRVGEVFDDAATGRGLLNFFVRGHACGALDERDVASAALTVDEVQAGSFDAIVSARAAR